MVRTFNLDAEIPDNRELRIVLPPEFPEGPAHIVPQVFSPSEPAARSTLGGLARSECFGVWRDRGDITDSSAFAGDLRSRAWKRSGG